LDALKSKKQARDQRACEQTEHDAPQKIDLCTPDLDAGGSQK
jgi:hypothetical protein